VTSEGIPFLLRVMAVKFVNNPGPTHVTPSSCRIKTLQLDVPFDYDGSPFAGYDDGMPDTAGSIWSALFILMFLPIDPLVYLPVLPLRPRV
jgi:hypothetical protein